MAEDIFDIDPFDDGYSLKPLEPTPPPTVPPPPASASPATSAAPQAASVPMRSPVPARGPLFATQPSPAATFPSASSSAPIFAASPSSGTTTHAPAKYRAIKGTDFISDIGQRCAILAFFGLLLSCGLTLARTNTYWSVLLMTFTAADVALLCGLFVSWRTRHCRSTTTDNSSPSQSHRQNNNADQSDNRQSGLLFRQSIALIIFSSCLLLPTLTLIILARNDRLNPVIDWTWDQAGAIQTWVENR